MANESNVTYWVDPARPALDAEDRTLRGAIEGEKRALDQIAGSLAKLANSGAIVAFSQDTTAALAKALLELQKSLLEAINNRFGVAQSEFATLQSVVKEHQADLSKLQSQLGHVAISSQNAYDRVETAAVTIDEFRREWSEHKIIMADMARRTQELEERVAVDEMLSSENDHADPTPKTKRGRTERP